jgi:hypothetical protein
MPTALIALLQAVATLLALVSANPSLPPDIRDQALAVAKSAIAEASRPPSGTLPTPLALPAPTSGADADANAEKVRAIEYFLPNKEWVRPGAPAKDGAVLSILDAYTSFGYLDAHDLYNDAVVVVQVTKGVAAPAYYLATLVNNSGVLAHTDLDPLPPFREIYTHRVSPGSFVIELEQAGSATRRIFTYQFSNGALVLP